MIDVICDPFKELFAHGSLPHVDQGRTLCIKSSLNTWRTVHSSHNVIRHLRNQCNDNKKNDNSNTEATSTRGTETDHVKSEWAVRHLHMAILM